MRSSSAESHSVNPECEKRTVVGVVDCLWWCCYIVVVVAMF